ncbi:MAG: hypothetical protein IJG36_02365 [Synergistaceae bacterium]|nr:hypothetical protein [Synergistaceae bacterium]
MSKLDTPKHQRRNAQRPCSNIFRNVQSRNGALISLSGGLLIYHFINSLVVILTVKYSQSKKKPEHVFFERATCSGYL